MGDLGHELSAEQQAEVGQVDVLLIPVGGFFTIDAQTATKVAAGINPKVIIPMHYLTKKLSFPIKGVDLFLKDKSNVTVKDSSEVELKANSLPSSTQIIVLQSAL
jgi:L-ascorbate metabolism protein UlaG (beta-lactamase superfamily)